MEEGVRGGGGGRGADNKLAVKTGNLKRKNIQLIFGKRRWFQGPNKV